MTGPGEADSEGGATAHARRLLDIVNASWATQAAYVAAALAIPDHLAAGPKSTDDLARDTGAHAASLRRLMRALATLEICRERDDGLHELAPLGELLRADVADSLRSWTLYWGGSQWPVWGNLLRSVMTGESARPPGAGNGTFGRLDADAGEAAAFNGAMVELTRLEAANIVRAYDFAGVDRIMDVGGGYGELLAAILAANPDVRGVLFDRPQALENGRRRMEEADVAARCEFVAGDFFRSIPGGAGAYVLKSVIHDWNDEHSQSILRNCRTAMDAGARLLLVERIVPRRLDASAAHRSIARADLNMLVGPGGRERTEDEYRNLLHVSGLRVTRILPAGPVFHIVEAMRFA